MVAVVVDDDDDDVANDNDNDDDGDADDDAAVDDDDDDDDDDDNDDDDKNDNDGDYDGTTPPIYRIGCLDAFSALPLRHYSLQQKMRRQEKPPLWQCQQQDCFFCENQVLL